MERVRQERSSSKYLKHHFDKDETPEIPPLTYAPGTDPSDLNNDIEEIKSEITKALEDNAKVIDGLGHTAVEGQIVAA